MKFIFTFIISILIMEITKVISFTVQTNFTGFRTESPLLKRVPTKDIHVSTVDELYKEVNKQSNENNTIILAPGIYTLNVDKSTSTNGRLELQRGMQLKGELTIKNAMNEWPAIIDGSQLPKESFTLKEDNAPQKTGFIRIGRGTNSLSYLAVMGNSNSEALSAIDTDLDDAMPDIHIDHVIVRNSKTGIDIRNGGLRAQNRKLTAFISDSEFLQNTIDAAIGAGQGITIQNSVQADGASIDVKLKNNISHENNIGMRVMNQNTSFGKISIESTNDRFESNQLAGILIIGGMNLPSPNISVPEVKKNTVSFTGSNTTVKGNGRFLVVRTQPAPCGIYVVGGYSNAQGKSANSNSVDLWLDNPILMSNQTINILAFGAWSGVQSSSAGVQNKVSISCCPPIENKKNLRLISSNYLIRKESNIARQVQRICVPSPRQ